MASPWPLFSVLVVFGLLLVFARKMNLGYALFLGTILLGVFFRVPPADFLRSIRHAVVDPQTATLVGSILLILVLSEAMKAGGELENIVKSSVRLFHDVRLVTFILPSLIGMLPMPGGAYVSAPMVDTALRQTTLTPAKKLFANYWFRHVWEYVVPIYPGIVAAVALSGIPFPAVVRATVWLAAAAALAGAVIVFGLDRHQFHEAKKPYRGNFRQVAAFARGIYPVFLVLALTAFLSLPIIPALAITICLFMLTARFSGRQALQVLRKGLSLDMVLMLLGISFFKAVLSDSGAVAQIALFLKTSGIGVLPVIVGVSFLSGFVTGLAIAAVGLSFPIALPLLPAVNPWSFMFVYAAAFGGVLLSPVHLCLVITCQFFEVRLGAVYRYLVPATLAVLAAGLFGYHLSLR